MNRFPLVLCFLVVSANLRPATVPHGFSDVPVVSGLNSPTAMAFAPDGRVFVCEQTGAVRVVKNGVLLPQPFVQVTVDSEQERGLGGIALHPNFANNGFLYIYYTRPGTPVRNVIVRYTAAGDTAAANSAQGILELDPLSGALVHNGGAMQFGPDGKLYVSVGENARRESAQSPANLLGKILRMEPDGTIPADNPFSNDALYQGRNKLIYALGFRNTFTFDFQPGTGRLFANDVGENTYEEINDVLPGGNYGWPNCEGPCSGGGGTFHDPFYHYGRTQEQGSCAITGGAFYNPPNPSFPFEYQGTYFFADYCGGWIQSLNLQTRIARQFLFGADGIVSVRIGPEGSLYYLQRGAGGQVRRVDYALPGLPAISRNPQDQIVEAGAQATFSVVATGDGLSYQWRRNAAGILGATGTSYTLGPVTVQDDGALFDVVVAGINGSVTSTPARLTVRSASNQPPVVTVTSPAEGTLFTGGQTLQFAGVATDPETGALPASRLRWRVDYVTGQAVRPYINEVTGTASGSFVAPTETPYVRPDVYFLIHLTATDPTGVETTVTRRVNPRLSNFTLQTSPPGLPLTLDGQPIATPLTVQGVVGILRNIAAAGAPEANGTRSLFQAWSHGGAAAQTIATPPADTTYTASFKVQHLLTTLTNPSPGGTITAGGWIDVGTGVPLNATPNAGFQFTGFSGDAAGTSPNQIVFLNGPRSVTANFRPTQALTAQVVGQGDGPGADTRIWTLQVTNTSGAPIPGLRLTAASIRPSGPVVPELRTALPLSFGSLGPGASAMQPLTLHYPRSTPPTNATLKLTFSGDGGLSATVTLYGLPR